MNTGTKPLHVRLIRDGEHFEHRGQLFEKVGLSIPDRNNRLGRQHLGMHVVSHRVQFFRAQTQVRKQELPS